MKGDVRKPDHVVRPRADAQEAAGVDARPQELRLPAAFRRGDHESIATDDLPLDDLVFGVDPIGAQQAQRAILHRYHGCDRLADGHQRPVQVGLVRQVAGADGEHPEYQRKAGDSHSSPTVPQHGGPRVGWRRHDQKSTESVKK